MSPFIGSPIMPTKLDSSNQLLQLPPGLVYGLVFVVGGIYVGVISTRTVGFVLFLLLVAIGMLVYHQEKVLYIPVIQGWKTPGDNPSGFQSPEQQGLRFENVSFFTADGVRLHGWFIPAPQVARTGGAQPATVLFCHENAGNIGLRIPEFKLVHSKLRVNQFVFDYRGYGASEERQPDETGLVADAVAAFNWLATEKVHFFLGVSLL